LIRSDLSLSSYSVIKRSILALSVFLALASADSVQAQCSAPRVTADSFLNTGTPTSVDYTAPGTSSGIAIVSSVANPAEDLWELFPNPWNAPTGSGSINMTYSGTGSIATTVNLTGLNIDAVNAFPLIFYGSDEWGDHVGAQPPTFPVQLSSLCSLVSDVAYSFSGPTLGGNTDILYDEYLIPNPTYTGGQGGAFDVAIIPYFNFAYAPGGTYVKTIGEPVTVNGVATTMNFKEYVGGSGPGAVVDFDGDAAPSGELRLNLVDFFNEAILAAGGGIVNSGWWVSGIQYGPEFGDGAVENFTFSVTKFELDESTQIPLNVALMVKPHQLRFGNVVFGTTGATSAAKNVTIANPKGGNAIVQIGKIAAPAGFNQTNNCSALAPGDRCKLSVTMTPTALGVTSSIIIIQNNTRAGPLTVALKGMGVSGKLTIRPLKLAFGEQPINIESAAKIVALENPNSVDLLIDSVNSSAGYEASGCVGALAAHCTCQISVTFKPTAAGSLRGTLRITDNAAHSPQSLNMTGAGE
jgi:hypothetical protein